jgi:membrane-associated protein
MDSLFEFLKQLVNPESIIHYGGLYLLLFVVFAETGLFVGFFLPGDSLIFTAGLLCATGELDFHFLTVISLLIAASVTGNMVGYSFGKKMGVYLYNRKSSFFFRHNHIIAARDFYAKHGGKAIVLCRFLPVVRTFAPIVAGIVVLNYKRFFLYNVIGAVAWITSIGSAGYFLGHTIPQTKEYLGYIVIFLIIITTIPVLIQIIKAKKGTVPIEKNKPEAS